MSHPSFCFFAIFCIPSLLSLLLIPPICPSFLLILLYPQPRTFPLPCALPLAIISHTPLFCSYIIQYLFSASHVPLPFTVYLSSSALPYSTISLPFQCSCCPLFPIPSCHAPPPLITFHFHCSSITHNFLFIFPSIILHFSILPSPATSSCSLITHHILSLLVFYHHVLSIPPSLTCHLTSASHPFLPSLTMSYSSLCFSITMTPFFLCSPVSHHVPSLLPMICHFCISFFPALFFHLPSLLSAFLHHPPHPIHPSCVPPSPTTSHPLLSSWTFHHLISFLPPPPPCLFCLHPPSPRLFLSCFPCQHFTIPSLPP